MRGIDLVGVTTTEEVLGGWDGLAKAKPGETAFGSIGWRAPLTRKDLDQLSTDVPIVALRGRRGAALFNSAALKKAGIAKDMTSYMGKAVPKDTSGELTGELPEWPVGFYAVDKVVPLPTPEEEDRMIVHGQKQRNALGITSIRDLSNWPPGMRAFVRMWRQGRLTLRVSMGIDLPTNDPLALLRQRAWRPASAITGASIQPARIHGTSRRRSTCRRSSKSTASAGGIHRTCRPTSSWRTCCRRTKPPTASARSATSDGWSSTFRPSLRR
jgi:predicted amidohydrolase YtcJ